ncbi:MAG: Fur family transcriptional regulator [Bryobacteraceae bacterium]
MDRRSLLEELTSKGVRLTTQRRALIEAMQEAKEHLDVSSLLSLAREREPGIDRATVYRTIEKLKRLGLVDELDLMHLNGEKHYYEVRPKKDHVHLACLDCGRIEEYSSPLFEQLKSEIADGTGFEIQVVRLEVGGRCSTCRSKKGERKAG